MKRDRQGRFRFASLQGPVGQVLLERASLPAERFDSFVLVENNNAYTRSSGALRVFRHMGGIWSLLYIFWIIPRPIRDGIYDWVARHRYRWFGKQDSCWLPRPEWKERFLD